MGSAGSKAAIIKVSPKDYTKSSSSKDFQAKKTDPNHQSETAVNNSVINTNVESSPKKTLNKQEELTSSKVEGTTVQEKVVVTSENADEILRSKGFDDAVLATYCRETPDLLDVFIKIYGHVESIKQTELEEEEDLIAALNKHIKGISSAYQCAKKVLRIKKGNLLVELEFADVYKDVIDKLLGKYPNLLSLVKFEADDDEKNTENKSEEVDVDKAKKDLKKARVFLKALLMISINYTDLCDALCIAFSKAGLVPIWINFIEQLKDCTAFHLKWVDDNGNLTKKTDRGLILTLTLGTLHNMAKRVATRVNFHACNAVTILVPYLEDPIPLFATKALLALAYLIDESNEELIKSKEEPITFMLSILQKAIAKTNKKHIGLSSSEIANGLAQISINDNNKKSIVSHGAIPILMTMIRSANDDEERIEAVNAIWTLTFDDDNRIEMRETEELLELLTSMKLSNNKELIKVANGALWEIEGKQSHSSEDTTASKETMKNHIMISYQWDVQKTLIQVKNQLQSAGFKVWMDMEQMGGSTLAAMAEAVEESAVVLICISQKYKESANCRSEAEYAFQLKKDIVPLMMEKNYRPTGWLGMIMGSKLWIDFSQGLRRVETSVKELMRELGSRGKEGEQQITALNTNIVKTKQPKVDISGWTNNDVMNWIGSFDIETKEKNSLHKLNGTMLMLLHSLRNESPNYYYASLKDDIGLYDVCSVLRFTHELEKLCE